MCGRERNCSNARVILIRMLERDISTLLEMTLEYVPAQIFRVNHKWTAKVTRIRKYV